MLDFRRRLLRMKEKANRWVVRLSFVLMTFTGGVALSALNDLAIYHGCSRCRHGYFHMVNNDYAHWEMYAIGGSANTTINSQGDRFIAPNDPNAKEVTKRVENTSSYERKGWNWRSSGDLLLNGAFFTPSGAGASSSYARASSLGAKSSSMVATITSGVGALNCRRGSQY